MPLTAQQLPLSVEEEWTELEGVNLQIAGKSDYAVDIVDCPGLDAECIVVQLDQAEANLTYTLPADSLRGRRIRFSASMLVEFPAISRGQLFVRVDHPAGVGWHEYTDDSINDVRDWASHELVGEVDRIAKYVTVGLRTSGAGTVYLVNPKLEAADRGSLIEAAPNPVN